MRPIKFRGKSKHSNQIIFGGYYKNCFGEEFIIQPNGEMNRVDSVEQFVGYDSDGNEIYEGDTVSYICDEKAIVRLSAETTAYSYIGPAGEKFVECYLVGKDSIE